MLTLACSAAFILIGIAMVLSMLRLVRGPHAADRILAFDTLYIDTVALLIVLGIDSSSGIFFEAALLIALTGFIGTVSLARYLARGDVME
ncbi:MAG: K+/H+ antiporter subunit F [Burkholderiales bacterium]|jgi:multicomponent K+:H+ antiporter subunit F